MQSRPKTYKEFINGITVVYRPSGGIKILCKKGGFIVLETKNTPWNTKDTKKTFLVNLYLKEVIHKINLSKHISRPQGYELLGKRCLYRDTISIIFNAWDAVNPDTGEVVKMIVISNKNYSHPLTIKITEVQL